MEQSKFIDTLETYHKPRLKEGDVCIPNVTASEPDGTDGDLSEDVVSDPVVVDNASIGGEKEGHPKSTRPVRLPQWLASLSWAH